MEDNTKSTLKNHFNKKSEKIDPATLKEGGKEGKLKALEYFRRKYKEDPTPERKKQLEDMLGQYKRQEGK